MPARNRFKSAKLLPIQREHRQIQPRQQLSYCPLNTKWDLGDKKKLLHALKICDPEDVEKIQADFLPHRSMEEVAHFIKRMKIKSYLQPVLQKQKVPIELWVDMVENLTFGITDCSTVLGEVISKIENEEVHDQKCNTTEPDWHAIYSYLGKLLRGEEVANIEQIEAGILLDLLNAVAGHLRSLDIGNQRLLMARKYALLSAPLKSSDKLKAFEMARKALEEDLLAPVQSNAADGIAATSRQNNPVSSCDGTASTSVKSEVETANSGQDGSASNITGRPLVDGVECGSGSTSTAVANRALQSRQSPLFAINPFCIPIKYLNPPKRATPQTSQPQTR